MKHNDWAVLVKHGCETTAVTCLQKTHQFLVPEIEPETTPIKHRLKALAQAPKRRPFGGVVNKAQPQPTTAGVIPHTPPPWICSGGATLRHKRKPSCGKSVDFHFWIFAIFGDFSEFIVFPLRFPLLSICIFWIFIFPDFCKTSGLFSLGFFG